MGATGRAMARDALGSFFAAAASRSLGLSRMKAAGERPPRLGATVCALFGALGELVGVRTHAVILAAAPAFGWIASSSTAWPPMSEKCRILLMPWR
jgi:hypothetical protein